MLKKRVRSSNFNGAEEDILVRCILRYASIIENKKTDACTLKEKQRAWQAIGNEFNSLCPNVERHTKALRDKYTNLKTMLRKQFAAEKACLKTTGGSGGKEMPEWRPRTVAMAELAKLLSTSVNDTATTLDYDDEYDYESHDAILPPSGDSFTVESDDNENPLDSSNPHQSFETLHTDSCDIKNEIMDNILPIKISQPSTSTPWSKYSTPSILPKPKKSKPMRLPTAASSSLSSRSDIEVSLQSLKKKLIARTLEMREIEHETRLSQQQKEHEARMALLEAKKMDFESKVRLRELKIAKLTNRTNVKTEVNPE